MAAPTDAGPTEPDLAETRPSAAPGGTLSPGAQVGRYQLLELIGSGGGGAVYAAWDLTLKRKIALKVLHSRPDDPGLAQVLREARALAQFSHPNVVAVFDVGEAEGRAFIAMELAQGELLEDWLRQPGLAWHQALRVFLEAGKGLAAVHRRRLVHRDFKPGNVVVREDGRVQLIDFGIARPDERPKGAEGEPALVAGTPGYMAPEHMRGEPTDARSDQFSFCCAVYDALTGTLPFGQEMTAAQLVRIEQQQLAAPAKPPKVPRRVMEALKQGLAFDPQARHRSMDELVRALARTLPLDRRAWPGLVALSLAAGATIGFVWLYTTVRFTTCGAEIDAAQAVWTPKVRAALAPRLPSRALLRLDGFAANLVESARGACVAAREQPGAAVARLEARACLARARRDLGALSFTLQSSSALEPVQVEAAVDGLVPASECLAAPGGENDTASARLAACQTQLFDASSDWLRGRWARALSAARTAGRCAHTEGASDLEANALRLEGAVLERTGDAASAHRAYRASVERALRERGEPLALAWVSLARLEGVHLGQPQRGLELLDWVDALLARVHSVPATRTHAALLRARLQLSSGGDPGPTLDRALALLGEDPTHQVLVQVARAHRGTAERGAALSALGGDPGVRLNALIDLADALVATRAGPGEAVQLLGLSERALAEVGGETALARSWFGGVARGLGAAEAALAVHRGAERDTEAGTTPLVRGVLQLELARDLRALGRGPEATEAAAKAATEAEQNPEVGAWLSPLLAKEAPPPRREAVREK